MERTNEPTPAEIGQRITLVVEELTDRSRPDGGIQLTRFAADLGISLSTLHRWMKGENTPSYAKMVVLADITGRPLDWFTEPSEEAVA